MADTRLLLGQKTFGDYDRANQEFQMRKQAAQMKFKVDKAKLAGGDSAYASRPAAAIQIANSLAKFQGVLSDPNASEADKALAEQGILNTQEAQKIRRYDAGTELVNDVVQPMPGQVPTLTALSGAKEEGGQIQKSRYEPRRKQNIRQREADVDLVMQPQITAAKSEAVKVGGGLGEAKVEFADLTAAYPALIDVTNKLQNLAQVATYTKAGRWNDAVRRQLNLNVRNEAEAAAEMGNIIKVEILPILKPTFGAQFTVVEGQWLLATLGNEDMAPAEKMRQISARVAGWNNRLKTLSRRTGEEIPADVQAIMRDKTGVYMKLKNQGFSEQDIAEYMKRKGL